MSLYAIVRTDTDPKQLIAQGIASRNEAETECERRASQEPPATYRAVSHRVAGIIAAREDIDLTATTDTEDADV